MVTTIHRPRLRRPSGLARLCRSLFSRERRGNSRLGRSIGHVTLELLEGRVLLSGAVPPDDFGNTFTDAALVTLDSSGAAQLEGNIDYGPLFGRGLEDGDSHPGDVDHFRFVAQRTGR